MSLLATIALVVLLAIGALVLLAAILAASKRHSRSAMVWLFGLAAIVVAWLIVYGIYQLIYDTADRRTSGVRLSMRVVGIGVALMISSITAAKANNYGPDGPHSGSNTAPPPAT